MVHNCYKKYDPASIGKSKTIEEVSLVKDKIKYEKFKEKQYHIVKNIDNVIPRLPNENEILRIVTQLRFNNYVILSYILDKINPIEIILTSYRIGKYVVVAVDEIAKTGIPITIVLSSFFTTKKSPDPAAELLIKKSKINKNLKLIFCRNHAKITTVKAEEGFYSVGGSGNMTGNARIEEYWISKSKSDFYFTKKWVGEISKNKDKNNYFTYNI